MPKTLSEIAQTVINEPGVTAQVGVRSLSDIAAAVVGEPVKKRSLSDIASSIPEQEAGFPAPRTQKSISHEIEELDKPTPQEVATQTPRGIPIVPSQFRPGIETGRIAEDVISGLRRPAEAVKGGIVALQEDPASGMAVVSPLILGVMKLIGIEEDNPDFTEVGRRMASGFLGEETPASRIVDNFMGQWKSGEPTWMTGFRATMEGFFEIAPDPLMYAPEAHVLKWTKAVAKAKNATEAQKIARLAFKELGQSAEVEQVRRRVLEPVLESLREGKVVRAPAKPIGISAEVKQTQKIISKVPEPTPSEVLTSRTAAENRIKQRINIVRKDMGIGDDEYRQILRDTVEEDSLRQMNIDQLRTVENEMLVRKKSQAPRELGDMMDELDRNIDLAGGHANERDLGLVAWVQPGMKPLRGTNIYELTDAALKQQTIFETDFATSFRKVWGKDIKNNDIATRVTQYLEGTLPAPMATPRIIELGEHTRKLYNVLFREFNIDPNRFLQFYSPRIRKAGSLQAAFPQGIPNEIKFFGEMERRGGLAELETNQIKLFSRYLRAGSKKKFLEPLVQELLPEIKTLPRGTQMYAREYLRSILGFPTRTEILMDNSLRRLAETMNKVLPASHQIETGGRLSMQATSLLRDIVYTGGLGFKPGSAIKNLTQTTLTMAEVGYTWTARGAAQLFTAEGRTLVRKSGIFREIAPDLSSEAVRIGAQGILRKTADTGLYLFGTADRTNRSITYLSARGKLLNRLQRKKPIDRMLRHVDPQPLKRIKAFQKEGRLVESAEAYGKWASDEVQFVYSKSATPLIFRNPIGRVGGIFGTWPINFGNYWVNVLKHKQFEKLARYIGAAYAISAGAKQANMDMTDWFMTGPLSTTLGGPVASMGRALYNTTIGATQELWKGATGANTKYAKKQRVQGTRQILQALPVFVPGGVAAKSFYKGVTAKGLTPQEKLLKSIGLPIRKEQRKRTIQRIR